VKTRAALAWSAAAAFALLGPGSAAAHLGNISYSEIEIHGNEAAVRLKFASHLIPGIDPALAGRVTRAEIAGREHDILKWLAGTVRMQTKAGACEASILDLVGPDGNDDLLVALGFRCPGDATSSRVEFHPFDAAIPDYRNIVSVKTDAGTSGYVFTRSTPVLVLGDYAPAEQRSSSREFFTLGVEHIATGYDHLLFLLALFLPGGSIGRLAGIVTSFTIAHSITLALTALDVVRLPVAPVEILIALSIVFAGVSALRGLAHDRRWALTFWFGLVHGLGFGRVLLAAGMVPRSAVAPLLAFNLGVESGQLAILAVAVPLLRVATREPRDANVRRVLAWGVIVAGVFWTAARTAAWLGG
jgi:hydrogenase/urease accessory protein HupE